MGRLVRASHESRRQPRSLGENYHQDAVVVARERGERLVAARTKKGKRESVVELNELGKIRRAKRGAKPLQHPNRLVDDQRRL